MNGISFVIHKCLKFSHEGVVHIVHGTGYQPLVSHGEYSLDHFWPSLAGSFPLRMDILYKNYVRYKTRGKGKPKLTLPVTEQPIASSSREEKNPTPTTIPYQKGRRSPHRLLLLPVKAKRILPPPDLPHPLPLLGKSIGWAILVATHWVWRFLLSIGLDSGS